MTVAEKLSVRRTVGTASANNPFQQNAANDDIGRSRRGGSVRRKLIDRVVSAFAEPLWQRDKLEMRAADALLSAFDEQRRRFKRRAMKTRRPSAKTR